ncbi:hypothetical protein B0H14DRAFT_2626492 [Mycena olivaceomarginata]|nr:hypothetical protein B0H14DRAFT_2626492 [Mycena olivaceomarginata]
MSCVCVQYDTGSDYEECAEGGGESEFRACRIPYEADRMVAGLGVADLCCSETTPNGSLTVPEQYTICLRLWLRDFVDEAVPQEDGVWRWQSFEPDTGDAQTGADAGFKRQKALQELRDGGYVD